MGHDADALVIGAGPAGASVAILLSLAGWRVIVVEQHRFPRHKVCGECITAGTLSLLDELGVGSEFDRAAGPPLQQVGWMSEAGTVITDMPACTAGAYRYGRALGRNVLDLLLLERARAVGVTVLQPARVRSIDGEPGRCECAIELLADGHLDRDARGDRRTLRVAAVLDAHGSWERGPEASGQRRCRSSHAPKRASDLLAFKATFRNTRLQPGLLPVIAFRGGYGGMVVADHGRTTVACCIRRDALQRCRATDAGRSAGAAAEAYLRRACQGVSAALEGAQRDGPWLSVGPIRPGIRVDRPGMALPVGNAAGEAHPLVGEGIGMAMRSAWLLFNHLVRRPPGRIDAASSAAMQRAYAAAWRQEFVPRLRVAAAYAGIAMNPALAAPAAILLGRWPRTLSVAARLAGKARDAAVGALQPGLT